MAVTASTPANLVIGAGDILIDDAAQGATADDNVYRVEQEIFEPDNLNGVPGMLVGTQYKVREEAILEATLPEIDIDSIALVLPGWAEAPAGTLGWDGARRIAEADLHDYELQVPGLTFVFGFVAANAINLGNAEFSAQDAGMMAPRGEFHSRWDAANLTTSPHRITKTAIGS